MSWQWASLVILALAIVAGFAWFERSRPTARVVAAVAALAALAVAGRVALAPIPNLVATTDVALLAGYTLGGGPGFAVGAIAGLVSNFWLGQGPWTPWQMAGWGLVGVGGAALARVGGRELGRLQLALWAGLAGLAYGALLDLSVMVSYGGEQSLDRYLALSARGIPFNLVHAAGNFMLMFAAGPAFVRILDRYRGRFDHRWSDRPIGRIVACAALALCLGAALLAPPRSEARAGGPQALLWLAASQNPNGGWGSSPGSKSSAGMTGWAMLALEAAGINPRDIRPHGRDAVSYLRRHASEISSTGDLELAIIALVGAGVDPRSFADRDLVGELRDRRGRDGSFEKQVNLTAYGIIALRAAKVDRSKLAKSSKWLRRAQNGNGGWGSTPSGSSEPDSTGAVLQALAVAPGGGRESAAGLDWLRKSQHGTGGWSLVKGSSSNTQSTAWAVQGIIAAGGSPGSFKEGGKNPFKYLKRRQRSDGHYAYSSASDQTPVWVTAQGITAAYGAEFPIKPVARAPKDQDGGGGGNGGNGDDTDTDTDPSTTNPDLGDYGPSGTDLGDLYDAGASDGTTTTTPEPGTTTEEEVPPEATGPSLSGTDRERIAAGGTDAAAADDGEDKFDAPATPVLLGGLGGLATLLGAGFLWFSRRLP
jgi:energy-coupling factor transport system substrate-specific component